MTREIKFRAWDKKNLVMRIWDFLFTSQVEDFGKGNWVLSDLMQYTGLKDKNGKEIYEGDILASFFGSSKKPENVHVVEWGYKVSNDWDEKAIGYDERSVDYEIIGNIYENPELIK